ncbi:MAG: hypothetical protein COX72_01425 [Gammaproteobacteria bacterium CG_4_10_14_0_2_um_filter_38_22]|nr:MAG: hypothetical protein COX72_01425 [Gammaproteobacteria bacterium CG_4_10_14_0_2_um_filter_38_22]PJC38757.1 MAG: hypothetical protein CO044_03325 [Candidatus Peregrinibacteria bacterium CG_4_9_14_0_2_um_filter_38_9]
MKDYVASHFRWLLILVFLSVILFSFCALPAFFTDPVPPNLSTVFVSSLVYLAQNFLFACLLGLFLLPIFLWVRSDFLKAVIALPFLTATFFMYFVTCKVFSFWRIFISGNLLSMYFSKDSAQVVDLNSKVYIWVFLIVTGFILISIFILWLSHRFRNHFKQIYSFSFFAIVYFVVQVGFVFFVRQDDVSFLQYTLKVPYFYDLSLVNMLNKLGLSVFPKSTLSAKLRNTLSDDHSVLNYPLHPLRYHLPAHPLNVLLIVVDTLRYDMINPRNMPHVFQFAQQANQFLDNISGGDCTRPGIFSLFYGLPATYWKKASAYRRESIIIKAFQKNHYQLGIFASAPLTWPAFDNTVFSHVKNLPLTTPGKTALDRDAQITADMQHFLKRSAKTKKHFFGFLFYDAPHAYNSLKLTKPFHPVASLNYFNVGRDTPRAPFYHLYQNAVFADDQFIQKIFVALKKNQLMKNTVVIITADHGQEFNDNHNNYWEHASGFSKYQVRTPMIIAWPNRAPHRYHEETTHFDLAPTLLKRVLGVANPAGDYSVGHDYFHIQKQPRFVLVGNYAYYALITRDHIFEFHHSGLYRTTDLKMNALPNARINQKVASLLIQQMKKYSVNSKSE